MTSPYATCLMILPTLSKISPIWLSLTISGGLQRERVADRAQHQVVLVIARLQRLQPAFADGVRL